MTRKTLLSGVQPTGRPHIGNYFGAMKQFVDLQKTNKDADKFFMIVDYHGLNFVQDAVMMRQFTLDLALDYLAIGIDPSDSVIFKQSDVSAHTELAWIFNTIVTMPYLMRAHAFKDAEAKNKEINVGTFDYPVLMAADILLYDTNLVPVGQDQKQHVEYARDIALKFNHIFKTDLIQLPESMIMENVGTVPGTDDRKMSKSYGNTIPLFATRAEVEKAVMSIVTDSSGEMPINVYNIHKLFRSEAELKSLYELNKGKYGNLKKALIEDIDAFIAPMRERRAKLTENPKKVLKILAKGAKQADKRAGAKLAEIKKAIGVL